MTRPVWEGPFLTPCQFKGVLPGLSEELWSPGGKQAYVEHLLAIQETSRGAPWQSLLLPSVRLLQWGLSGGDRAPPAGLDRHTEQRILQVSSGKNGLLAGSQRGSWPHGSWGWRAVRNGGGSVFRGLVASLLSSEHLLLASLSVDPAFSSYSSACCMTEHTSAEFWQPVDWVLWAAGPPRYRSQVQGPITQDLRLTLSGLWVLRNSLLQAGDTYGPWRVEPPRWKRGGAWESRPA